MTHSIRTRLLAGISVGMALLLIVFSFVIYGAVRRSLIKQFDASLLSTARMLAASVEQDKGNIGLEIESQQVPEFQKTKRPTYYELWRQDGTVAAKSPSIGTEDFLRANGFTETPVFQTLNLKDGRPVRAVGFKFNPRMADSEEKKYERPDEAPQLTLVVARDAGVMQRNLQFLRRLLLIASASIIVLSFIVGGFVVRQGLAPLNSLAAEIAAVKENNLTSRITAKTLPTEIQPIRSRLNEMLARLEASFNRERQFTANVAHELRTPLAGIRSTIEVILTRVREQGEYQVALSDCLTIAKGMQNMVDNLLALSRIETNQATFRRDRVRVAEIIDSCWRLLSHRADERRLNFENSIPAEMTCNSDADGLSMIMSNLLDNAVEYTNQGGQIKAEGQQVGNKIEITLANTGCRLSSEEVSQVFDCFWRGDSSRTDTGTHFGLGLALVQRIIIALGGSAAVEVQPGGVFTMRIVLPA
jgi:two-component system, OmpR family, heavy metal sensor histidine kinase CusS